MEEAARHQDGGAGGDADTKTAALPSQDARSATRWQERDPSPSSFCVYVRQDTSNGKKSSPPFGFCRKDATRAEVALIAHLTELFGALTRRVTAARPLTSLSGGDERQILAQGPMAMVNRIHDLLADCGCQCGPALGSSVDAETILWDGQTLSFVWRNAREPSTVPQLAVYFLGKAVFLPTHRGRFETEGKGLGGTGKRVPRQPPARRLHILWDIENVCIPRGTLGFHAAFHIRAFLKKQGLADEATAESFRVFFRRQSALSQKQLRDLDAAGADLVCVPGGKPEAVDLKIQNSLAQLEDFNVPAETVVCLLTSDYDFVGALRHLKRKGFRCVLVRQKHIPEVKMHGFYQAVDHIYLWQDVLSCETGKLPAQNEKDYYDPLLRVMRETWPNEDVSLGRLASKLRPALEDLQRAEHRWAADILAPASRRPWLKDYVSSAAEDLPDILQLRMGKGGPFLSLRGAGKNRDQTVPAAAAHSPPGGGVVGDISSAGPDPGSAASASATGRDTRSDHDGRFSDSGSAQDQASKTSADDDRLNKTAEPSGTDARDDAAPSCNPSLASASPAPATTRQQPPSAVRDAGDVEEAARVAKDVSRPRA